ncbi:FliH/SctL family protein [Paraclostridium ghonii]|uniref:Flagellar assembly protein FliH n=1 Tax=Paraclostridium ghonii TaxID=29358 RepID=A0ABU0MWF3_9FIRM|nr:FliH/SctL family protein [Paeniclostridium ghonii]MDQ0555200.1 flagellar assembly protein FliH [Paeniclostridium ghonii]
MSLFKNNCIIKSDGVVFKGVKPLKTTTKESVKKEETSDENEEEKVKEEIQEQLKQAKNTYDEVLEKAQLESEKIIQDAYTECDQIKKRAYEEGHNLGVKNGYEDGYKESYEDNIEKAKQESEDIINKSNSILIESKNQVLDYLKDNKKEIISLSIFIAEKVLKEKFEDVDSMNKTIENTIKEYEIKENFVIRTNAMYIESINEQLNDLKSKQLIKGEAFVLADEFIEPGNAVIETNKGRLIVGVDCVLDKIKEELL